MPISLKEGYTIFKHIKQLLPYKIYIAGSIKRLKPIINDIDIVVITTTNNDYKNIITIMKKYLILSRAGKYIISGVNNKNIQVDLFLTKQEYLPYMMLQYTGPKEYNIYLRSLAKKRGWKLNQYGIFYQSNNRRVKGTEKIKSEKDIIHFITY